MSDPAGQRAKEITKASGSNLALAFFVLPRGRRDDITAFYAFCREIDDIADDPGLDPAEKQRRLDAWRNGLVHETQDEPPLAGALRAVIEKYNIPIRHFHEIIAGVEMDLAPRRYETFEDLRVYCDRVAGAVGLVSIEIFGYRNPTCRRYALDLGMALQLTNILRDVGQDLENGGRIYLPRADLERFGYTEADLHARIQDERFRKLMACEARRARLFFHSAEVHLPPEDRRSMLAARIMAAIYTRLLRKMESDGFRVFERRYKLGRFEKLAVVALVMARHAFSKQKHPPSEEAPNQGDTP